MECYKIEDLTFTYPDGSKEALSHISLSINAGEFVTICGKSGCGKSTLLRQLKPILSAHGTKYGRIFFEGTDLSELSHREQAQKIGFVIQSPDNQIVTDKVWHELAFGLESLSFSTNEIRTRVSEMASFFGIQTWFHKKTSELSGGQKQLLNLASVMVMQPSVLILDEPTSQLDPIAAQDFLETLSKINRELGTTIILTEHRLEEALPLSDRVLVMSNGKILADGTPREVGSILKQSGDDMYSALPTPMRVHYAIPNNEICPVTVREGKKWLENICKEKKINYNIIHNNSNTDAKDTVVSLKDVYFRYEKDLPDVIKGLSLEVNRGELYAMVGGNGTGKTTALSIISSALAPYRGKIDTSGRVSMLPQNPQVLFTKSSVKLELLDMFEGKKLSKDDKEPLVSNIVSVCELEELLNRHPYDLSGGEQQRAALAKVLLPAPDILLLDEPTKGLDSHFKEKLADILSRLKQSGITIIIVSHDIEFCAKYADRCGMFFDGSIIGEDTPRKFFSGKSFYTTAANRMARGIIPDAVLAEDIISACGETVSERKVYDKYEKPLPKPKQEIRKENPQKKISGKTQQPQGRRKLTKRTLISVLMVLIAVPLTIFVGMLYLGDRKYYFISMMIIFETILPFLFAFEKRKPQARELIIVSVLCAVAVLGRTAFYMLPQFKPVTALIIISGVCFGGETGFLVGAVTGFVSNFFFGQGPWTPWQMFAFGMTGFFAGILFKKGLIRKTKASLCIFGGLATVLIYGGIINPSSVLMYQANPNMDMIITSYIMGLPYDLIHALSTVIFLWFISVPMIEKLERIKTKYGLMDS